MLAYYCCVGKALEIGENRAEFNNKKVTHLFHTFFRFRFDFRWPIAAIAIDG